MLGRLDRLGFKVTTDAQLARLPRGLEAAKGSPVADYVCWKTFIVDVALSDAEMQSPDLVGRIIDIALATRPLLDWGWAAEADDIPPRSPSGCRSGLCRSRISKLRRETRRGLLGLVEVELDLAAMRVVEEQLPQAATGALQR
jgi:hypothetical protein